MLTVEVKVNGGLVGFFYIVNRGTVDGSDATRYSVEYYKPGAGRLRRCEVTHFPHEGALVLVKKAISKVMKEERDES